MNCLMKKYIDAFDNFFKYLIADNVINTGLDKNKDCNNLYNFLQINLKNTNFNNIKNNLIMSSYSKAEKSLNTCTSILKTGPRRNSLCGKKTFSSSDYCKTHYIKIFGNDSSLSLVKQTRSTEGEIRSDEQRSLKDSNEDNMNKNEDIRKLESRPVEEEDNVIVVRKNKYNNFVFGNTGLIIKSAKEKYIVAREAEDGNWLPLDREDIEECERYHLKYKIIDFNFKGEKTNQVIVKSTQILPDGQKEKEIMFQDFIEDEI